MAVADPARDHDPPAAGNLVEIERAVAVEDPEMDRVFRILGERLKPRPRDLEVTYTPEFTEIVHELRGHIGASRAKVGTAGVAVPP